MARWDSDQPKKRRGEVNRAESRPLGRAGRMGGEEAEITLGMRSLLGIFFGLVLICGIFFGLGYSVGRAGGSRRRRPAFRGRHGRAGRQPRPQTVTGTNADAGRNGSRRFGFRNWPLRSDGQHAGSAARQHTDADSCEYAGTQVAGADAGGQLARRGRR